MLGGDATFHTPHRVREGYGMREDVIERAAEEGVKLLISVDTGIREAQVVERARELGIDAIISPRVLVIGITLQHVLGGRVRSVAQLLEDRVEILEVDPPRRLVQTLRALWSDEVRSEGFSRVTWEIEAIRDSCRLIVTHDQLRDGAHPELYGGWPMILSGLKTWLETGERLTTPGSLRYA